MSGNVGVIHCQIRWHDLKMRGFDKMRTVCCVVGPINSSSAKSRRFPSKIWPFFLRKNAITLRSLPCNINIFNYQSSVFVCMFVIRDIALFRQHTRVGDIHFIFYVKYWKEENIFDSGGGGISSLVASRPLVNVLSKVSFWVEGGPGAVTTQTYHFFGHSA